MVKSKHIKTVEALVQELGRDTFTEELGHATQVVSRAIVENKMPAHWYVGVRDICLKHKITVSESLFRWARKSPANTQNVNSTAEIQGSGIPDQGSAA